MNLSHRAVCAALTCAALIGCGCAGDSKPAPTTGAAAAAPALPKTDPQNLFDCLGHAHARVSIDPSAAPRRFLAAARAVRAVRDGTAAMAARFADGTRADYDFWGTAARAGAEARAAHAEARDNVVVLYPAGGRRGRALAVTTTCVPR